MKEKFIALDIGNICVSLRYDKCLNALGLGLNVKIPDSFIFAVKNLEIGNISTDEWLNEFQEITNHRFSDRKLMLAYNEIIGDEFIETSEFVQDAVQKGYKIIFFSNISEIHAFEIFRKLSFAHLVSGSIFSYEVKSCKPDIGMYQKFEEIYERPVLYIDDMAENRETAENLNWKTKAKIPNIEELFV